MDQISAATSNNLLVQGVGHSVLVIKILDKVRGFIDEKIEYLATGATASIQKETIWRLHRGTSTKELFCEFFQHITPLWRLESWRPHLTTFNA